MNKTAVTVICSVAGTLAAVLSYQHFQQPASTVQSQPDELLQRMERLEQAITVFADMKARGLKDLTVDKLVNLRIHGID